MAYLIYGKQTGQKRFKAMDLSNLMQVDNIIYATAFWESSMTFEEVAKIAMQLQKDYKGWTFEVRQTS